MAKEFFTERDIEDMFKRGILSLQVTDNVVLTELAYEKANRLGMQLLKERPVEPPAAPVRPYISQIGKPEISAAPVAPVDVDLTARIRAAVMAQLGNQVDPALLDVIIQRVLKSTGVK
jgi:DNA-binding SARP family transcriptional activator